MSLDAAEDRTDEQLLALARDRLPAAEGRAAFDRFIGRHRAFAINLANSYVRDADAAQDLAQDAFLRLYQSLPSYVPSGPARGLLARIVRNLSLNHLKKRRPMLARAEDLADGGAEGLDPASRGNDDPQADADRRQVQDRLLEALDALKPQQQEAVRLRYFQGCSYEEISATLGITVNYVGVMLNQAIRLLRDRLKENDGP